MFGVILFNSCRDIKLSEIKKHICRTIYTKISSILTEYDEILCLSSSEGAFDNSTFSFFKSNKCTLKQKMYFKKVPYVYIV